MNQNKENLKIGDYVTCKPIFINSYFGEEEQKIFKIIQIIDDEVFLNCSNSGGWFIWRFQKVNNLTAINHFIK